MRILEFKWSVSRGRDTYGYNIVSIWENGEKVATTCGGGYDMKGTVFGQWLQDNYQDKLMNIPKHTYPLNGSEAKGYYGLTFYDAEGALSATRKPESVGVRLNGMCGIGSMSIIAEAIGLRLTSSWSGEVMVVEDTNE